MTRIIYLQFTNPGGYPPLEHSSAILAEAGAEVMVFGTTAEGTARMAWPERRGVSVEIMPKRDRGVGQTIDYIRFALRALRLIRQSRPDWLYASDAFVAPIALLARRLTGVRVLYHEHDEPFAPGASRSTRAVLWARKRLVRIADEVVVPNAERARRIGDSSGRAAGVSVVWNCPRRAEVRQNTASAGGSLRLIYQGSVARARLPATLVPALGNVPEAELFIVGYETRGSTGYLEELRAEAARRGVADRVHILGSISRDRLLDTTATCHVGLSFMPTASENPNEATMVGSSNKAFEYLACGLALLVSEAAEWREGFVEAGVARACEPTDVASIEAALRWLSEHREEVAEMGSKGQQRIALDWNYESQFAPVRRILLGKEEAAETETHLPGHTPEGAGNGDMLVRHHDPVIDA